MSLVPEYNHKTMAFTFFNLGREGGNKSSNPESINLAEILAFLPNMKCSKGGVGGWEENMCQLLQSMSD